MTSSVQDRIFESSLQENWSQHQTETNAIRAMQSECAAGWSNGRQPYVELIGYLATQQLCLTDLCHKFCQTYKNKISHVTVHSICKMLTQEDRPQLARHVNSAFVLSERVCRELRGGMQLIGHGIDKLAGVLIHDLAIHSQERLQVCQNIPIMSIRIGEHAQR